MQLKIKTIYILEDDCNIFGNERRPLFKKGRQPHFCFEKLPEK